LLANVLLKSLPPFFIRDLGGIPGRAKHCPRSFLIGFPKNVRNTRLCAGSQCLVAEVTRIGSQIDQEGLGVGPALFQDSFGFGIFGGFVIAGCAFQHSLIRIGLLRDESSGET
jgi:hypothetical protein